MEMKESDKAPELKVSDVYKRNVISCKAKSLIRKSEFCISIKNEGMATVCLPLFTSAEIKEILRDSKQDRVHFGAFRLAIIPLFHKSLNGSVYIALTDSRFTKFEPAKAGELVCSLDEGVQFVTIYPGFPMSLKDPYVGDVWKVLVAVNGLNTKVNAVYASIVVSAVYKLHKHRKDVGLSSVAKAGVAIGSSSPTILGSVLQELHLPEYWEASCESVSSQATSIQKFTYNQNRIILDLATHAQSVQPNEVESEEQGVPGLAPDHPLISRALIQNELKHVTKMFTGSSSSKRLPREDIEGAQKTPEGQESYICGRCPKFDSFSVYSENFDKKADHCPSVLRNVQSGEPQAEGTQQRNWMTQWMQSMSQNMDDMARDIREIRDHLLGVQDEVKKSGQETDVAEV